MRDDDNGRASKTVLNEQLIEQKNAGIIFP